MSIITRINKAEKRIVDLYNKLKNLPSGGGASGDFVPLTGTTEGNPVTGIIETESITGLSSTQSDLIIGINDIGTDLENLGKSSIISFGSNSTSRTTTISNIFNEHSIGLSTTIDEDGVANVMISAGSNPLAKGFTSDTDHSEVEPENKLIYAQRSQVDERGSVFNATTSVLSASDLNTAYPNAKDGFSVIAPNVVGGGKYYIKAGAGWVYQQILAVV